MISLEELHYIMPRARHRAEEFIDPLNVTMHEYGISANPLRVAHFLAQVAHESDELRYTEEIASGDAYEGRVDLGNTEPGDGRRFKGHGLIQLTGRANHELYAEYKYMSLEQVLDYLQTHEGAADVSGWYWMMRKLNTLADGDNVKLITKRINGGFNGYAKRVAYLERAKEALA